MDEKFLIHVDIAGKSYGIRIKRSEEEMAREAARQIREKLSLYRKAFAKDVDARDLLAMVAFQLSLSNLELEKRNDTDPFAEKIQELTNELENYLQNK